VKFLRGKQAMAKDTDGANFVTDDNTGGYFVCKCQNCGEVFNSKDCDGGRQIADTGDYGDCYCPHCGQVDPEECDNPSLVWNVQQAKINRLMSDVRKRRIAACVAVCEGEEFTTESLESGAFNLRFLVDRTFSASEAHVVTMGKLMAITKQRDEMLTALELVIEEISAANINGAVEIMHHAIAKAKGDAIA
jgi:hypothetical protein